MSRRRGRRGAIGGGGSPPLSSAIAQWSIASVTTAENLWPEVQPKGDTTGAWNSVGQSTDGHYQVTSEDAKRLWLSTTFGLTWTELRPAGDVNKSWAGSAIDDTGQIIVANVYGGRMYRSINGGTSWTELTPLGATNGNWNYVATDATGQVIVATVYVGRAWRSVDGGVNWAELQPLGAVNANWAKASVQSANVILLSVYAGRLWLTVDGGTNWTEPRPLGNTNQNWQGTHVSDGGQTLAASISPSGRVYRSLDGGSSWGEYRPIGDTSAGWSAIGAFDVTILRASAYNGRAYLRQPNVTAAADQVGSANLTQATPASQPWQWTPWSSIASPTDVARTLVTTDTTLRAALTDGAPCTIMLCVRRLGTPAADIPLLSASGTGSLTVGIDTSNRPYLTAGTPTVLGTAIDREPHVLTWTVDGDGNVRVYLDGALDAGPTPITPGTITPTSVTMTARSCGIAEAKVWSRAITSDEVLSESTALLASYPIGDLTLPFEFSATSPVKVAQSEGTLYAGNIWNMSDGTVVLAAQTGPDIEHTTYSCAFSVDDGVSYGAFSAVPGTPGMFQMWNGLDGNTYCAPIYLRDATWDYEGTVIDVVTKELTVDTTTTQVTGVPFALKASSLWLCGGSFIDDNEGGYLAACEFIRSGQTRRGLLCVRSTDLYNWVYESIIADSDCPLTGTWGPSEPTLHRMVNGELECIFRLNSGAYCGRAVSNDDGATWGTAASAEPMHSVAVRSMTLDNGCGVLVVGRDGSAPGGSGMYLWVSPDNDGNWTAVFDVASWHNLCHPTDQIVNSWCYLSMRPIPGSANEIEVMYDNTLGAISGTGWDIWTVRIQVRK